MIVAIDGGLGSGKTYTAVWLGLQEARAGREIYANFDVTFAARIRTWRDACALRDGVFLWDETHLDIDSRQFGNNVSVTPWLTQTRKLGVDILYCSQNIDQVDKRLRNLTDVLIRCSKVVEPSGGRGTRMQVVDMFRARLVSDSVVAHDTAIYALFNTRQLVVPLAGKMPSLEELLSFY